MRYWATARVRLLGLTVGVALVVLALGATQAGATTFSYTGATQQYVVPAGVTQVLAIAQGADGGDNFDPSNTGTGDPGQGGSATAIIPVDPGGVLKVNVGGVGTASGAFNGGAVPGALGTGFPNPDWRANGGGGASDVRRGSKKLIVAGGGGGASLFGDGGAAGSAGGSGLFSDTTGGGGGTTTAGGAGGDGGACGNDGTAGTLGAGGTGGDAGTNGLPGGGGGGGYYGGGGGGGGGCAGDGGSGGGGGSSFIDASRTLGGSTGPGAPGPPQAGSVTIEPLG